MSWSLNASGHVSPTDATGTAVDAVTVEVQLYEALRNVLTDPRYGTVVSSFGGSHVSGSLHEPDQPQP